MDKIWTIIIVSLLLVSRLNFIDSKLFELIRLFTSISSELLESRAEAASVDSQIKFKCRTVGGKNKEFILNRKRKFTIWKLKRHYPVAFIIHGWADSPESDWVAESQVDWIKYKPANVCIVDWSSHSRKDYKVALLNAFDVAATIAKMIKSLEYHGYTRRNMTLVGFSLGAHIAGYTGRILKGKIGEIIGLDPAGPLFTMPVDVGPKYRLDPSDAKFVQVLHTSAGTLGTHIKSGHADFYPNGGMSPQASCLYDSLLRRNTRNVVGCSHSIVVNIFKHSINPKFSIVGYQCPSYKFYVFGICILNRKSKFGIHSKRIPGNFFLQIGREIKTYT